MGIYMHLHGKNDLEYWGISIAMFDYQSGHGDMGEKT